MTAGSLTNVRGTTSQSSTEGTPEIVTRCGGAGITWLSTTMLSDSSPSSVVALISYFAFREPLEEFLRRQLVERRLGAFEEKFRQPLRAQAPEHQDFEEVALIRAE